jgi:hypothetical protein
MSDYIKVSEHSTNEGFTYTISFGDKSFVLSEEEALDVMTQLALFFGTREVDKLNIED